MPDLQRILVPTDFTDTSEHALDWAIALAKRLGASITVMHAYEIPIISFPDGAILATPEVASRIADAARGALENTVRKRQDSGVKLDSVLREGAAWEEVHAVADMIDADMIVMGRHDRKKLARALLGSVVEHVVRTATRPVVSLVL